MLGSEGVEVKRAIPSREVHLHRLRLAGHDLSPPALEDRLVAVAQVLHELAEDIHKPTFVFFVR